MLLAVSMLLTGSVCFWQSLCAFGRFYAFGRICMLLARSVCFLGQVSPELRNPTHYMKVIACETSLINKRICSIVLKQHAPH